MTPGNGHRVTVAVPVYRSRLTPEEEISWRHLSHFLGHRDVRLFLPEGLESPLPGARQERFPARYFDSVRTYSRLLLSEAFYRRFEAAEYLLIYQLDALVFSDRLEPWCEAGYDYLGAPWWKDPKRPERGFARVGNGGLSLRRVEACLEVLTSTTRPGWGLLAGSVAPDLDTAGGLARWRRKGRVLREARRGARWYAEHYSLNEDRFWSDRAHLLHPSFSTAPPREALAFSFEVAPEECYRRNRSRLPFGCHGWWRYGREFWQPHLLPRGSSSAAAEEAAS